MHNYNVLFAFDEADGQYNLVSICTGKHIMRSTWNIKANFTSCSRTSSVSYRGISHTRNTNTTKNSINLTCEITHIKQ